jgi:hypothetical protein
MKIKKLKDLVQSEFRKSFMPHTTSKKQKPLQVLTLQGFFIGDARFLGVP